MAQAQRSIRQQIAIRHAIARRAAAGGTPPRAAVTKTVAPAVAEDSAVRSTPVVLWGDYTILTPIVSWKSSRSRKRVVRRVKEFGNERDTAMLLDHNAYSVVGTVRARHPLPALPTGDIYVSHETGQVYRMGRTMRDTEVDGRLYFAGHQVAKPAEILVSGETLAALPRATDLARQRHTLLTDAVRACNARFSRDL